MTAPFKGRRAITADDIIGTTTIADVGLGLDDQGNIVEHDRQRDVVTVRKGGTMEVIERFRRSIVQQVPASFKELVHGTVLPKGSTPPRFQVGMVVRSLDGDASARETVARMPREPSGRVAFIVGRYIDSEYGYKVPESTRTVSETDTARFALVEDHVWCDAATVPIGALLRKGDRVPAFRVGMSVRDDLEAGRAYSVVVGFESRAYGRVALLESCREPGEDYKITLFESCELADQYLLAEDFIWPTPDPAG